MRGRWVMLLVASSLGAGAPASGAAAPGGDDWTGASFATTVEQPRPFGYLIGDLLQQRVLLRVEGDSFTPRRLPAPGRISAWFERRQSHVESDTRGERWLVVEYQLVNAPAAAATVELPAWKLAPATGDRGLLVEGSPISVASMIPAPAAPAADAADAPVGADAGAAVATAVELQPDRDPPGVDVAAIRHRMIAWALATLAVAVAWLGWLAWRNWRAGRERPFAVAELRLRRLDPAGLEAWRELHQAFDRTAGQALHRDALARLFERAPAFEALRPQIERFYAESAAIFFDDAAPASSALSLPALGRALRRLERHGER